MAAAMTLEAETSDALAVQRTLPDDALRIAASASRRTARLETKRGCSCDVNRALPAIKNGGETLSLPTHAQIKLEPWLVQRALDRLGDRRLTIKQRATVVAATRTPGQVRWPDWWET